MTVLLVEDDPDIRLIARLALQQIGGFTVIEAASGAEALDILGSLRPDVVLLDVMMPGMDGTGVLRAMRETPATATVPVIFLTAKAMPAELDRLRALGARAILTKPFDPSTLPSAIRHALDARPASGDARPGAPLPPAPDVQDAFTVDLEQLQTFDGLTGERGGDLVGELIDMFETSTRDALRVLRAAAGGPGAADAERLAHSLKASAATLGAVGIAELARRAEALCREGRFADVRPLLDAVDAALDPVVKRLRASRPPSE